MKESVNYVICERNDKQWMACKTIRLEGFASKVKNAGFRVGDIVAVHQLDASAYTGRQYDPMFPRAIFGGFKLMRFVVDLDDEEPGKFKVC